MKKITLYIFALGLLTLAGCTSTKKDYTLSERAEISWEAFQKIRNHKCTKSHDELVNEYLDTWVGSVEEEKLFMEMGIEP